MKESNFRSLNKWFRVSLVVCLAVLASAVSVRAQAAPQADHFKALGPDKSQAREDSLFFPNDFEAAAASHPDPNGLTFFSLCRRAPFTSTTLYSPISGANVDAIVNDTKFTLVDGTQCYNPQNEQNIVINPTNSRNIVTSANDYRFGFRAFVYSSTDGGSTFADVMLPGWDPATGGSGLFKHVQAGGDPVLAFAPDGTLYYSALVYDFSFPNRTPSGVAVAVSHDGGGTWSAPVMVHYEDANTFFNDKEWIAAGAGGDVYVTWTLFKDNTSSKIVEAVSRDHGATWSGPIAVSDSAHPFEQVRINSLPTLAIDPTTGGLDIVWADDQNNAGCAAGAASFSGLTNNQVKLVTSANGITWTAPRIITSGADKAYPAVGANNGRTVVGYYTRDYSPVPTATDHSCQRGFLDNSDPAFPKSASQPPVYADLAPVCLDYAFSSSTDGYASETRVSAQSSNPYIEFAGSFIGDYTGVAVDSAGGAHTVWTDFRGHPGLSTNPASTTPNQDTVVGNVP